MEQLGLWTMLCLDVQHAVLPARNDLGEDFSGLNGPEPPAFGERGTGPSAGGAGPVPNVMEVDLEALAAGTENEDAAWLARYFSSVVPTKKKNEYTGRFQGYNVIQLSIEGFSGYAIDPELTPTLYRLTHEGFVFPNFYTPLHYTSTSGGECQNLLGLYPKAGNPITMKETGGAGTPTAASAWPASWGRWGIRCWATTGMRICTGGTPPTPTWATPGSSTRRGWSWR